MNQHTPVPWIIWVRHDGSYGVYQDQDAFPACLIAKVYNGDTTIQKANARLIAAAPEMLQALEEIVAEWSDEGYISQTFPDGLPDTFGITLARVLLAKIEGD